MADDPGLVKEVFELRQLLGAQIAERQRQMKRHRNQILFIAVGGLLGLLLVAGRGELNASNILDSRYQTCLERADQIRQFNAGREGVGNAIVALNPQASPEVQASVIKSIRDSAQPVPICVR